jgi:hypothetical protein
VSISILQKIAKSRKQVSASLFAVAGAAGSREMRMVEGDGQQRRDLSSTSLDIE